MSSGSGTCRPRSPCMHRQPQSQAPMGLMPCPPLTQRLPGCKHAHPPFFPPQRTSPSRLPRASPSETAAMETASTRLLHSLAVCPVPLPPPAEGRGGARCSGQGAAAAGRHPPCPSHTLNFHHLQCKPWANQTHSRAVCHRLPTGQPELTVYDALAHRLQQRPRRIYRRRRAAALRGRRHAGCFSRRGQWRAVPAACPAGHAAHLRSSAVILRETKRRETHHEGQAARLRARHAPRHGRINHVRVALAVVRLGGMRVQPRVRCCLCHLRAARAGPLAQRRPPARPSPGMRTPLPAGARQPGKAAAPLSLLSTRAHRTQTNSQHPPTSPLVK